MVSYYVKLLGFGSPEELRIGNNKYKTLIYSLLFFSAFSISIYTFLFCIMQCGFCFGANSMFFFLLNRHIACLLVNRFTVVDISVLEFFFYEVVDLFYECHKGF